MEKKKTIYFIARLLMVMDIMVYFIYHQEAFNPSALIGSCARFRRNVNKSHFSKENISNYISCPCSICQEFARFMGQSTAQPSGFQGLEKHKDDRHSSGGFSWHSTLTLRRIRPSFQTLEMWFAIKLSGNFVQRKISNSRNRIFWKKSSNWRTALAKM